MGFDPLIQVIVCGNERFLYYLTGDNPPKVFMNFLPNKYIASFMWKVQFLCGPVCSDY